MGTLGSTTSSPGSSASSANKTSVSKATCTESGVVVSGVARLSVSGGSASPRLVLYADAAGEPGAKLGESAPQTITNTAVASISFVFAGGPSVVNGTDYHVGLAWADPGTDSINYFRTTTANGRTEVAATAPDPFGTGAKLTGPLDVYLTTVPPTSDADDAFFEFF